MDIRWKNISHSLWLKLVAILIALSGALIISSFLPYLPMLDYALEPPEYRDSHHMRWHLADLNHSLYEVANTYHDEAFIESGKSTQVEFMDFSRHQRRQYNQQVAEINERYEVWVAAAERANDTAEVARLAAEQEQVLEQAAVELEETLAHHKDLLIETHLSNYHGYMKTLEAPGVYFYFAPSKNGEVISNIPATVEPESFFASLPAQRKSIATGGTYYTGITAEKFQALEKEFTDLRSQGIAGLYRLAAGTLVFLLGFGLTLTTAGKRTGKDGIYLTVFDHVYLDMGFIIPLFVVLFCGVGVIEFGSTALRQGTQLYSWLATALILLAALVVLIYGSMLAKRAKRGELIKHTLLYVVLTWAIRLLQKWSSKLRQLLESGPLAWRGIGLLAAYAVTLSLSLIMMTNSRGGSAEGIFGIGLFLISNIGAVLLIGRRMAELQDITIGTERIKNGDLSYRIAETGSPEMANLARLINNIAIGLGAAVENEVRSERMKAELITNVSHDLKTPLTSLITYIDLLKSEGLDSENAAKYLDVLDRKSQRLQALTEDLFEAAKAASGNIAMHMEKIDVGSLLAQGLGELSEKLEASQLDWRISIPEEKLYVQADGRLLWRVMENLLSNILKYALTGSRVYVEATKLEKAVCVTFKNISASALNIEPAELMERFTRGDSSRQGDGSGLGLSIARSLTELQGGTFTIAIDGDLFKALVCLPHST